MKKLVLFSCLAFVLSFSAYGGSALGGGVVLAQEQAAIGVSVSPVEIKNIQASVDAQTNTISGSFIIKNNSEKFIPDLGWRVYLKERDKIIKGISVSQPIVEYVIGKNFEGLSSKSERDTDFLLKYSPFLKSEKYDLIIQVFDKVGNFYASAIYPLDIAGKGNLVVFDELNCRLKRSDGVEFLTGEGGNFDPDSKFVLSCEIESSFSEPKIFKVKLTSAEQSILDYPNAEVKEGTLPDVVLRPGKKTIEFNLITAEKPQSYQNIIRLYNEKDQSVSDFLVFRYVVRGESATIRGLSLDKNYYQKGEQAKVSFSYFGSADLYWRLNTDDPNKKEGGVPLEGASAKIEIKDSKNNLCGDYIYSLPKIESAFDKTEIDLNVPIQRDCFNPQANLVILSKDQKPLSHYSVQTKSPIQAESKPEKTGLPSVIYIIAGLIIIASLILFFRKKQNQTLLMLAIVGLFGVSFFVRAESDAWNYIWIRERPDAGVLLDNVVLNGPSSLTINQETPSSYNFTTSYRFLNNACTNAAFDILYLRLAYYIQDAGGNIVYQPDNNNPIAVWEKNVGLNETVIEVKNFTLELPSLSLPTGSYQLVFDYRVAYHKISVSLAFPIRDGDKSSEYYSGGGIHAGFYYWGPANSGNFFAGGNIYNKAFVNAYCLEGDKNTCPRIGVEGYCGGYGCVQEGMLYIRPLKRIIPLTINQAIPALSFSANPVFITQGQSSALSWDSENTDSCIASGAWSGNKSLDGSESVSPSQTSTYTLTCPGPNGSISQSATITVNYQCSDNIDNDNDAKTDYPNDYGCSSALDNNESDNPQCSDSLDNDGDAKTDYPNDPGCSSYADNDEYLAQCSDAIDNDGDGKIDYPQDPGCSSASDNDERYACSDGIDNDNDGKIDYPNDSGCSSSQDNDERKALFQEF